MHFDAKSFHILKKEVKKKRKKNFQGCPFFDLVSWFGVMAQ